MVLFHARDLPFEFHLGQRRCFGQIDFDAVARRLDVADVDHAGQGRGPEAGQGAAPRVQGQVGTGPLVKPARRHHPGVFALKVPLLRLGRRRLVPWVPLIDWIAERVGLDEGFALLPIIIKRAAQHDAHAEVDLDQVRRHQLAIDDHAGGDVHGPAPLRHAS